MQTLVMKFGGSSVGSAQAIQQLVKIARREQPSTANLIIVVSAMSGITDQLIRCADLAAANRSDEVLASIAAIRARHYNVIEELFRKVASENGSCLL